MRISVGIVKLSIVRGRTSDYDDKHGNGSGREEREVQCHHPKYKYTTPKIPFLE
jgi:hypothetical protein